MKTPIASSTFLVCRLSDLFVLKLRCTVIAKERGQGLRSYVRHCISGIVGDFSHQPLHLRFCCQRTRISNLRGSIVPQVQPRSRMSIAPAPWLAAGHQAATPRADARSGTPNRPMAQVDCGGTLQLLCGTGELRQSQRIPGSANQAVVANSSPRSQTHPISWTRTLALADRWLPSPQILHP